MENRIIKKERENIVRKSNELINNTRYDLTELEQKIIIYLISKLKQDEDRLEGIELEFKDYCKLAGIKYTGGNIEHLKDTIQTLRNKSWWFTNQSGKPKLFAWVSGAEMISTNTWAIDLDKTLKPYLLELKGCYTSYKLINALMLKGKYSIRLYEILKSYAWEAEAAAADYYLKLEINELRELLNCDKYPLFKDFNKYILKKSIEEINDYTDIQISYKPVRYGRLVGAIEFTIREKDRYETIEKYYNQKKRLGE